jgi:transmembrane sensor
VTASNTDQDIAARWAIRIDAGELHQRDQIELDLWISQDERRLGALLRAQAALSYLDKGRALGVTQKSHENRIIPANDVAVFDWRSLANRRFFGGALVAGFLAIVMLGFNQADTLPSIANPEPTAVASVATKQGLIPLEDGSIVDVKTGGILKIAMNREQRGVRLEKGEAWFKVAHDKNRPFIVSAGDVRVRAVGTAFSVRLRADGANVVVTEGVVETWIAGFEQNRTRMGAGTTSFVANNRVKTIVPDAPAKLSVKPGRDDTRMELDGESIAYAVREMNKQNNVKLVVGNAAIGRETLVGLFRKDSPEEFAQAVAAITGARVSQRDGKIYIDK